MLFSGIQKLLLHTDSEFLINCITVWIHKWKKNGWKLSDGGQVINKLDLMALDEATQGIDVIWVCKLNRHTEIFICYKVNSSGYRVRSWTVIQ
jgi:ribonuclease HI